MRYGESALERNLVRKHWKGTWTERIRRDHAEGALQEGAWKEHIEKEHGERVY